MGTIYTRSAGCVAPGTLSPDHRCVPIVSTYDDGRKIWVCDWFERVWTFQELRLPKVLLFVSGDHVLTREEVYLSLLIMSPYVAPRHRSLPSRPNYPSLSIHDVLNALSPSHANTQRALMQTSKRGCSSRHIQDKAYGILGILPQPFSELKVDYNISLARAVLNLMLWMPSRDVLDALTFNTLSPAEDIHDDLCWSGMIMLDAPMEHPSSETNIYHPTHARVVIEESHTYTVVHDAPLWTVVITTPTPDDTSKVSIDTHIRPWPSIGAACQYAKLADDVSKVERSADYIGAIGRAERSLAAHWTLLKPLLENSPREAFSSILQNPPSKTNRSPSMMRRNRLGDARLFNQERPVLVCRSKADRSFHYGIVVRPNEDGTWHKVCTAAFEDGCVVAATRTRVEALVVIGK